MKIILPAFMLLLGSCALDISQLNGRWVPVAFYEDGRSLAAPLDSVALVFQENGTYQFRSIGFYRESGPYRVSGRHLFLTDTTEKTPRERVLRVLYLSVDTLKVEMMRAGKEQVLFLKKSEPFLK